MAASLPAVQFLRGRVGPSGCTNNVDDVLWVQGLLNCWLKSRSQPGIDLDGSFGTRTQIALSGFQRQVVGSQQPSAAVTPDDATAHKLLAQRSPKAGKISAGEQFYMNIEAIALDRHLLQRVLRLAQCLLDTGLADGEVTLKQGVRSPKVAHRWSTSWNIRNGRVPLQALRDLEGGKDLDGNLWYDKRWEAGLPKDPKGVLTPAALKVLWKQIYAQARSYYDRDAIAAEGYSLKDPRIKPNAHESSSNHISGKAIDVSIPWSGGARVFGIEIRDGENTDVAASRTVHAFNLSRPVRSERWHFQLPIDNGRGFVARNNLKAGKHAGP